MDLLLIILRSKAENLEGIKQNKISRTSVLMGRPTFLHAGCGSKKKKEKVQNHRAQK